jgi:hypothetical protein
MIWRRGAAKRVQQTPIPEENTVTTPDVPEENPDVPAELQDDINEIPLDWMTLRLMFTDIVEAGFTEHQACIIIATIITHSAGR